MSLLDLQRRFRELGRIRLGEKGAKGQPVKLSEFRLTSSSKELLDVAATVYGGEVKVWSGAPTEGEQYELQTGTDRLDVLIPPGEPLTQSWELWSGGGCQRRCNGVAQTTGEACVCPNDLEERSALAQKGKACKATTRLSIVLPRIPDIGVWRVETHGINAAVELPGTVDLLRAALESGVMLPAQLRLDKRTSKKDGQTRHFVVPVLELPTITTAQLMSGGAAVVGEIGGTSSATALPSPTPTAVPEIAEEPVVSSGEVEAPAPTRSKAVASMVRSIEVEVEDKKLSPVDLSSILGEAAGVRSLDEITSTKAGPAIFAALQEWGRAS